MANFRNLSKILAGSVFLWILYDFANSFLSAALEGLYFSQWVVIDNKFPDIWYGGTFSAATLLLLITAPFLGAWADAYGRKMPFLKWSTLAMIIFGVLLGIVSNSFLPAATKVILALIVFFFVQYFYQASLTFYNPLLDQLSTSKTRGVISGIGQLANNFGFVAATGIYLFLTKSNFVLFGQAGRNQVFLPATILFGLLALPMLFRFKEKSINTVKQTTNFRAIFTQTVRGVRQLFAEQKNVGLFLVAFMLISDAILTANLFFAIFMEQVYRIPDGQKFVLLTLMSLVTIPSCYFFGWLGDRLGLKRILILSCSILVVSFSFIALSSSSDLLYLLMLLVGLGWGGYYATARALLVNISPVKQLGEYFGFYSTFQKFASIIGPLTWGGVTLFLANYGILRYRIAVIALVALMVGGTLLLVRVREEKV